GAAAATDPMRGQRQHPHHGGAVDPIRRPPAEAGRRAVTRGAGDQPTGIAEGSRRYMLTTYSTSAIRVCLTDSRTRASHITSGVSGEIASASRISLSAYRGAPSKQFTAIRYGTLRLSKKSIGEKLSVIRRVSTSTTAPIAPRLSSSHMNQNRVCPGVPNRYRIRSEDMVIRPKSMATVVVFLDGTPLVSSTAALAAVITASV